MSEANGTEAGHAVVKTGDGDVVILPGEKPIGSSSTASHAQRDALPLVERAEAETELKSDLDRRMMRRAAFFYFTILSIVFFGILIQLLNKLIEGDDLSATLGALSRPHSAIAFSLLLLVVATVPMSLAFALIRISAERDKGSEKGRDESGLTDISPPQLRTVQGLLDLAKSMLGR
ncbi:MULTISPECIES: hypothetical protein [unclassified Lysobacter]|uniref:hypothetical protein n=1 Tax=unclassified Lysobacter TaxID=2635362 RepID=UPI0006F2D14E|nr:MULTISPECIES: hypothetical protein [unclassified Lysobacter]KRC34858.1 hypothetical protein ASE10_09220 [Lysobacter sp. Root76]KRD70547.1 hypothetical protein ASE45_01390 [Lysobacter sp. Root96]